jgi:Putative zincin peptidase
MRIHFGNVPEIADAQPGTEALQPIRGPRASVAYLLAGLAGFVLLAGPVMGLCLLSACFAISNTETTVRPDPPVPWTAILLTLLLYIPAHELLHLIWQPSYGLSSQSVLVIWPSKLRFGIYYDGCMSRTRWLLMRVAPLVALSLVPAVLLAIFQHIPVNHALKTGLEVLLLVNGVGSGGDVVAMMLVLSQVPRSALLCFRGGRAYWQPASQNGKGD